MSPHIDVRKPRQSQHNCNNFFGFHLGKTQERERFQQKTLKLKGSYIMLPWQVQAGSCLHQNQNLPICFGHHLKRQNRCPEKLTSENMLLETRGRRPNIQHWLAGTAGTWSKVNCSKLGTVSSPCSHIFWTGKRWTCPDLFQVNKSKSLVITRKYCSWKS